MKLIVGLGNPGSEYAGTKHNIGFLVVEKFAKLNGIKINKEKHLSLTGKGKVAGEDVMVALPQTYMNLSGQSISDFVGNEIDSIKDLLVVCDDINLELGKIRMRKQGSAGGQKGMESIIHVLEHDDFPRLRIGIATAVHKGDITEYVLSPFKHKDLKHVHQVADLAVEAIECFIAKGVDEAMTVYNKRRVGTS